jgi:hypothetical protein
MEIVALISIMSVLAWFLFGARNSVNLNNYTEEELKEKE